MSAGQHNPLSVTQLQQLLERCPFQRWLGLSIADIQPDHIVIELPWREELMSSPEANSIHGGILSSLIDAGGCYALAAQLGYTVPTVDLHVDYHRVARPGTLRAVGESLKIGRLVGVAKTSIFDEQDELVASGKGVYRNKSNSG